MSPTLGGLYEARFDEREAAEKDRLWREIGRYLQRYVRRGGSVIDVACDRGYFIRNVKARERWATDVRDVAAHLPTDVRFVRCDGLELAANVPNDHFDVVFMSNYLEHLAGPDEVVRQLSEARLVLRPGGRLIVLQPNIRLVGGRYWDFIDHRVALTERSLAEAVAMAGLETRSVTVRFLPYTTKSALPKHPALVRAYLRFPPLWRLVGKQTLLIAERT